MKIGSVDVKTVGECLDVLEAATQSDLWKQLGKQERMRRCPISWRQQK